jgi:murein DD-endopeptidase MepM/ murein hydrolase activator NlpD
VDFAFWWGRDALGTPILATHRGRVRGIGGDATYGNRAYVQNARWTTVYSHLQAILVPDDQWVERGQVIGLMGSTGKSTGPHVDYAVWEDGGNRNPHDYCACAQAGSDPAPPDQPPPVAAGGP